MCNSLYRALAACTLPSLCGLCIYSNVETTIDKCVVWGTSMYVQTYLDLSHREVSCGLLFFPWLVQLGAWPWRAAPWLLLLAVVFCY